MTPGLTPRHKLLLGLACVIFASHLLVAGAVKPCFAKTMFGDVVPCVLLVLAILAARHNFSIQHGVLPLFWKLMAAGFVQLLLSEIYWIYYDTAARHSTPSSVLGDVLFLLAHVFFLSAFLLRPHSASAGRNLRLRHFDFALLTLWWLALYAYFALPWQMVVADLTRYNPANYTLDFVQHLVIILGLLVVCLRETGRWRLFYARYAFAFTLIAVGNLLLNVAISRGIYDSGGFYDTPFHLSLLLFTANAVFGPSLQPREDKTPAREIQQSLWTARIAMVAILTLPPIAFLGAIEKGIPGNVASFRLYVIFGALLLLSALVFRKLALLTRELAHLVRLSHASLANLKTVQAQAVHAEKLSALGRLAAGATHEISNPLTAILGYSEILTDLPALSPPDRESAQNIQQQVRRAQGAVDSLRNSLRNPDSVHPIPEAQPVDS
jgi:signal transduction histidine kinase